MLLELKLDVYPEFTDLLQSFLHLSFLDSLVCDFLDIFGDFAKLKVPYVLQLKVGVDYELDVNLITDGLPMALSHGRVSEGADKKNKLKPLLYLLENTDVSIASLIYFHCLELLFELLRDFVHLFRVGRLPSISLKASELSLTLIGVIPEALHEGHFALDLTNLYLRWLNEVRMVKFDRVILKVFGHLNELINLSIDANEGLESLLTASVIPVEVSLLHLNMEVLKSGLVVVNGELVCLCLIFDFLGDLFLHFFTELLQLGPFIEELLGLFGFLLLGGTVAGKEL